MRRFPLWTVLFCVAACSDDPETAAPSPTAPKTNQQRPARPAAETRPPRPRDLLLKALPKDTLCVAHIPDGGSSWTKLCGTVYGALIGGVDDVEVALRFKPYYEEFERKNEESGALELPPWSDIESVIHALDGEVMLALLDLDGFDKREPDLRALGGVTVHGAGQEAMQLIQLAVSMVRDTRGLRIQKTNNVWQFRSDLSAMVFEIGVDMDTVLFGFGVDVVTKAMRRMRATQAEFQLPTESQCYQVGDLVRLHVNFATVFEKYLHRLPADVQTAIKALRIDRLRSYNAATRIVDERFENQTWLDSPGGYDLLTRMVRANPVNLKMLEELPPELASFSLFTFNAAWLLENLRAGLPPAQARTFDKGIAELRKRGIELSEATLGAIGPQYAQLGLLPDSKPRPGAETVMSSAHNTAWIVELNDRTEFQKFLDTISEYIPTRRRYRIGRAEAITFDLKLPMPGAIELRPSFGLTKTHVFFALHDRALRRALEPGTELSAEKYRELLEGVPDEVSSVTYDSLKSSNLIGNSLLAGIKNSPARTSPLFVKLQLLEGALNNLAPARAYTYADGSGVFSLTDSPTGGMSGIGGLAGVAVVAAIAIPNLMSARAAANESAAMAMLSRIRSAQEQYRARVVRDSDGDDAGEYGFLGDLIAPTHGEPLLPKLPGANGRYMKNGYIFRVFLPDQIGRPIGESKRALARVDPNLAERFMVAVAWPVERGKTGKRSFVLNTNGEVFFSADGTYGGRHAPPPDILCFEPDNLLSRPLPNGALARDGLHWYRAR